MKAKTATAVIGGIPLKAGSILLLGVYFYAFLGGAPVTGLTLVHSSLGLEGLISLDGFFALCHVAAYAGLTLILCAIFPSAGTKPAIAAILLCTGVAIEILQEAYFGRQFQIMDVFANMTGIAVAMAFLAIVAWRSATPRRYL